MKAEAAPDLELQIKVSKMLALGFVFSIVPLAGIGSFIAFISGVRALRMINESETKLSGKFLAWWCIIVGGLGMILVPSGMILTWTR
jgi:undecaprenyl pyrophosphate phosphatase UppP